MRRPMKNPTRTTVSNTAQRTEDASMPLSVAIVGSTWTLFALLLMAAAGSGAIERYQAGNAQDIRMIGLGLVGSVYWTAGFSVILGRCRLYAPVVASFLFGFFFV